MSTLMYAKINKRTLKFIRENLNVSFNYIERHTKFSESKVSLWEDEKSDAFPTIRQAKALAKCYHVPFAGFYMDSSDITLKSNSGFVNKRSMTNVIEDDSVVNLALIDLINARDVFVETKEYLHESIMKFDLKISDSLSEFQWAEIIRNYFDLDIEYQYKLRSKRQFYLYLRKQIESKGIFIQCFQNVDVAVLRGVAIYDDSVPVIGINDKDRYPAKSFSIIHELVHIIKRTSSICNDMFGLLPCNKEEVFCNAVSGQLLVPATELYSFAKSFSEFSLKEVDFLADKFCVSSEVIVRRLVDIGIRDKSWYDYMYSELDRRFNLEKEKMKTELELGLKDGPKRNMPREAVDRTSSLMCDLLLRGYSVGLFDKSDISSFIGIKQKHINNFISEVKGWYL